MTNFTKTLFTTAIIFIGAAGCAQAADNTFSIKISQDNSVSVDENYSGLKLQVRAACKLEVKRAGYTRTEKTAGVQSKCEKNIMAKVIKATNNPDLTLVHNERLGETVKIRSYAQK